MCAFYYYNNLLLYRDRGKSLIACRTLRIRLHAAGIEYATCYGNEELGYWNVLKRYASGMTCVSCVCSMLVYTYAYKYLLILTLLSLPFAHVHAPVHVIIHYLITRVFELISKYFFDLWSSSYKIAVAFCTRSEAALLFLFVWWLVHIYHEWCWNWNRVYQH